MITSKAILFDLDGTLIDTAPDFIRIIRQMCAQHQYPCPSDEAIREQVSAGARAIVKLMFGESSYVDDDPVLLAYRQEFLDLYEKDICIDSCLFDGLDEFLTKLEGQNIAWGIVTNKPRYLAMNLLSQLNLDKRCAVLVCPEDVQNTKPDPEGLLLASQNLHVHPNNCLYIGDHPRDIEAGKRAGMATVVAGFGYIPPEDKAVTTWGADHVVTSVAQLVDVCQTWLQLSK